MLNRGDKHRALWRFQAVVTLALLALSTLGPGVAGEVTQAECHLLPVE
jgi:hypothetical protein